MDRHAEERWALEALLTSCRPRTYYKPRLQTMTVAQRSPVLGAPSIADSGYRLERDQDHHRLRRAMVVRDRGTRAVGGRDAVSFLVRARVRARTVSLSSAQPFAVNS
jgi:hypothetical protein